MRYAILGILASCVLLAACARESAPAPPTPSALARAGELTPRDEKIAALYQQSCRTCHSLGAGGAPLTGDQAAWDERWKKGLDALRSSTISGLNGMPPGGQCFACTPRDYEALITFMAGRGPAKD